MPGQQNNLDETSFVPIGYYPKNDEANKDRKGSWQRWQEVLRSYERREKKFWMVTETRMYRGNIGNIRRIGANV